MPVTTVYGGDNGIKLFIKHKIIEMVYAYEDSDWEIQSISIIKFDEQKKKQQANRNLPAPTKTLRKYVERVTRVGETIIIW